MNKKMKKAWNWVEEHKVEIGLGALCVAGAAVGVTVFKNQIDPATIMSNVKKTSEPKEWTIWPKKLDILDLGVGALGDAKTYKDGTVELWMDQIPLSDMGHLGEAISDAFPDLDDASVWALMCINPNKEPKV